MKIPSRTYAAEAETARAVANQSTLLYDLGEDAGQLAPLADHDIESNMIRMLLSRMEESDAPVEQYERLGLPLPWEATDESILAACFTEFYPDSPAEAVAKFQQFVLDNTLCPSHVLNMPVAKCESMLQQQGFESVVVFTFQSRLREVCLPAAARGA